MNARVERRSKQVGLLEDEKAIRSLHRAYENYLDNGEYKEAVNLFTDDAEVIFNGGAFKDKRNGIYRLYCDHFKTGLTGKKMDSAPGFQLNAENRKILFGSPQIATRQRPDSPIPYRLGPL